MNKMVNIFFVDDDPKTGELMQRFSQDAPYSCQVFTDPELALQAFKKQPASLIVSDLRMPKMSGIELLNTVRELNSDVPFIIVTGYANIDDAIDALRLGANDFIKKPFDMDELGVLVEKTLKYHDLINENTLLKHQLEAQHPQTSFIGNSAAMNDVNRIIHKISDIRCHVLIEGETGTGKELAALAIHQQSLFADSPYVVIDCGALTDTLLESELFGYVKGAFTGATQSRVGLLESACGGTVFLDEIANISEAMQAKLLRVVQENQITRVGSVQPINIDVRFIVATNQNLQQLVADNRFRHDLYHRLNVVKITMPPLRERPDDIPVLVKHFVRYFAERYQRQVNGFNAEAMQALCQHNWPGNVRELLHLIERHVALADQPVMALSGLSTPDTGGQAIDEDLPTLAELEQRYINRVLLHFNHNREKSATTLGINKSTLWRKLQGYQPSLQDTDNTHNSD